MTQIWDLGYNAPLHLVAETRGTHRVAQRIDSTMRRVARKLRGTIVDWNPVDRIYTIQCEGVEAPVRMYAKDVIVSNVSDVGPPPASLPTVRDRTATMAGLRASLAAEEEQPLDPNDLVPYQPAGFNQRLAVLNAPPPVVVGIPVYYGVAV